jgi:DNA-binding NarL/FixJ family response regulator
VSLGGADGLQVAAEIKRCAPASKLAVLTSSRSAEHLRQALLAGVDGYLLKDSTYNELLVAMRSIVAGRRHFSPEVSGHLVDGYLHPEGNAVPESPLSVLTARERSILQLIAEGRSNRSVGELLGISTKTIEKHRANVMRKLGLRNSGELMLMAMETGLIARPGIGGRRMISRDA